MAVVAAVGYKLTFQVKITPKRNTALSERPPTCNFFYRSDICKGYIRVRNCGVCLEVYKNLKLGSYPVSDEGLTARMSTLKLSKFNREIKEEV